MAYLVSGYGAWLDNRPCTYLLVDPCQTGEARSGDLSHAYPRTINSHLDVILDPVRLTVVEKQLRLDIGLEIAEH